MSLSKRYNPRTAEPRLEAQWQEQGIYHFEPDSAGPVYSIDTPPPTVSGHLHLGHVYSYSHTDFFARFWRMNGKRVFYPMGFDDNGLPTSTATYIMEYEEKQEGNYLYRTLTLVPGRLSVHGANATSETRIIFEQLEILEEERDDEFKDRAKIAVLRVDPDALKDFEEERYEGKAKMLKIRVYEEGKKKVKLSLDIPWALADLALAAIPEEEKAPAAPPMPQY